MTIQELENKIRLAAQSYYEGKPIMSDKDFDAYIAYLKAANPDSEILTATGWGYDPFKQIGEKEEHLYVKYLFLGPKDSIDNYKIVDDPKENE